VTTDRPYRAAMTPDEAVDILHREVREGHLDKRVVDAFAGVLEEWEERRRTESSLQGYRIPGWPRAQAA
jgi:HD-GYP domain-containing protein (c-di-GMP phosphodiesterase class II)